METLMETRVELIALAIVVGRPEVVPDDVTQEEVAAAISRANEIRWKEIQELDD